MAEPGEMFVVYDHPRDLPNSVVIRRWVQYPFGPAPDPLPCVIAPTIERARAALLQFVRPGLTRQPPHVLDDPVIAEIWA